MWQKGCALLVGLIAVLGFGWVSAQEPSSGWSSGASYILKAGDCVTWPSGHAWYMRMTSTSSYPFKVVTTSSSGRAVYAKAPAGGYAVYADGRLRVRGAATVDSVRYNTPRSHFVAIGSEAFVPTANLDYTNLGWACVSVTGSHSMVAPLNLPDGAVVTAMMAFFCDASGSSDLTVSLQARALVDSAAYPMAAVDSSGITLFGSKYTNTIALSTIDYGYFAYRIVINCDNWSPSLQGVSSVIIYYRISEAE